MALDKKEIALTVVGSLAGLTLTYMLWKHEQTVSAASSASQAQTNAQAQALAQQNALAQYSQEAQYAAQAQSTGYAGGSGTSYYSQPSGATSTAPQSTPSSLDVGSIISDVLGNASTNLSSIPAQSYIPSIMGVGGVTSLSGVATTASEILGGSGSTVTSSTTESSQVPASIPVHTPQQTRTGMVAAFNGSPINVHNPTIHRVGIAQVA